MDSAGLGIVAILITCFGVLVALTPTILWIVLTVVLFNKGEAARIENGVTKKANPVFTGMLYVCFGFAAVILAINNAVMFLPEEMIEKLIPLGWGLTVFWTVFSWIPLLISLIELRDKGLKYRKWFIFTWVLNTFVFFTGVLNPIPQSV
jgi:hypothetical protein